MEGLGWGWEVEKGSYNDEKEMGRVIFKGVDEEGMGMKNKGRGMKGRGIERGEKVMGSGEEEL